MGPQKLIAPRRAISADDLNFSAGTSHRRDQVGEEIEDPRVVMIDLAGAMVAEEMIQPREGLRNVARRAPVNHIDALSGVGVIKAQMACVLGSDRFRSP